MDGLVEVKLVKGTAMSKPKKKERSLERENKEQKEKKQKENIRYSKFYPKKLSKLTG